MQEEQGLYVETIPKEANNSGQIPAAYCRKLGPTKAAAPKMRTRRQPTVRTTAALTNRLRSSNQARGQVDHQRDNSDIEEERDDRMQRY